MEKSNAGRKKLEDKKETVHLFIRTSVIKAKGGKKKLQASCYEHLGVKETDYKL